MLSNMKNRVPIAGCNPFVRSLDNKLTDPNIHTGEMVEPLLFGEIEIGPSNQMHSSLPCRARMPLMPCSLKSDATYTWFTAIQMGALAVTSTILALVLVRFKRGASGWQPSSMAALVLRFLGHNTLEIYAAQLIVSPIILEIWPHLVF